MLLTTPLRSLQKAVKLPAPAVPALVLPEPVFPVFPEPVFPELPELSPEPELTESAKFPKLAEL